MLLIDDPTRPFVRALSEGSSALHMRMMDTKIPFLRGGENFIIYERFKEPPTLIIAAFMETQCDFVRFLMLHVPRGCGRRNEKYFRDKFKKP